MKRALPVAGLVLACTQLTGDFGDVVAIELVSPRSIALEEGDSVTLEARALDASGAPVPEAGLVWEVVAVNPDSVGITVETETGFVQATAPGMWQVRPRVETLRAEVVTVRVTPAPDLVQGVGDTAVTVPVDATQSASLLVGVFDLTTTPGDTVGLSGKQVAYEVTGAFPAGALDGVAVGSPDAPLETTATTAADGVAGVVVRRIGTVQPDSTFVSARVLTALGAPAPGSPVRFVVLFENP